jgi:uncharacterized protein
VSDRGPAGTAAGAGGSDTIEHRQHELFRRLATLRSVIVAFSGGTDSAYLAWAAHAVLGRHALAVTADSPSYPDHHRRLALGVARRFGLRHEFVPTGELERPEYRANPVDRCYYCKHELYSSLSRLALERGFAAVADGNNADDRGDYRPGRLAAREFGVLSPLDEAGLGKAEIRELSRRAGLPTWNEPASACLSSRIPYHSEVSVEKLRMIERAEAAVRALGFQVCRVRHHQPAPQAGAEGEKPLASVEIGCDELPRTLDAGVRRRLERALARIGYGRVRIDPRGYRMGSLNEGVRLRPVG